MQEIYGLKIFKGIDKNVVDSIVSRSPIEKFNPGDVILKEGDPSNGKGYVIKSGEVVVEIGGKEVSRLGVGEIFGEMALLSEEKRIATIKALSQVETIVLTKDDIFKLIDSGNETINKDIISRLEQNLMNNYY